MRKAVPLTLLFALGLTALSGCAQQRVTTITPTEDELPVIPERGRVLPVSVLVEGRAEEPITPLVPKFEEPELTPEERLVLGEEPETINWLEFYQPLPASRHVAVDTGGVSVGISGMGGPELGFVHYAPVFLIGNARAGIQGVHRDLDRRYMAAGRATSVSGAGGTGGIQVRVNPVRRVANHQTRSEP